MLATTAAVVSGVERGRLGLVERELACVEVDSLCVQLALGRLEALGARGHLALPRGVSRVQLVFDCTYLGLLALHLAHKLVLDLLLGVLHILADVFSLRRQHVLDRR